MFWYREVGRYRYMSLVYLLREGFAMKGALSERVEVQPALKKVIGKIIIGIFHDPKHKGSESARQLSYSCSVKVTLQERQESADRNPDILKNVSQLKPRLFSFIRIALRFFVDLIGGVCCDKMWIIYVHARI